MSFSLFLYYIHICLKQNKSNNEKILLKVPLLNFEGGPGVLLSNFEGGPRVPLLNFRGVLGPTLKLWGGSPVPGPGSQGPEVPATGALVRLHHAN